MKNTSKHHLVPQSKWGSSRENNLLILQNNVHCAFHLLFENRTPVEQLEHLALNINGTALTRDFKIALLSVLECSDKDYIYEKGVLRKDYKPIHLNWLDWIDKIII
jgi:hypothetical protein